MLLYTPVNYDHADVLIERHEQLVRDGWCFDTLNKAPFPVTMSMQGFDCEILGKIPADFAPHVERLSAPYNHALMNVLADDDCLRYHAQWLMDHGVHGNADAMFFPEFAPSNQVKFPETIVPIIGGLTGTDPCLDANDAEPGSNGFDHYKAIRYYGKLVVPMRHASELIRRFYVFQRVWTDDALSLFIDELRRLADRPEDDVAISAIDLEAPYVGSCHGKAVWERLFEAIDRAGLSGAFTSFRSEKAFWEREAVELPHAHVFARRLDKWTGHQKQVRLLMDIARLPVPKTDAEHRVFARVTTSDCLVAHRVRYAPVTFTSDGEPVQKIYNSAFESMCDSVLHNMRIGVNAISASRTRHMRGNMFYDRDVEAAYDRRFIDWLDKYCSGQ